MQAFLRFAAALQEKKTQDKEKHQYSPTRTVKTPHIGPKIEQLLVEKKKNSLTLFKSFSYSGKLIILPFYYVFLRLIASMKHIKYLTTRKEFLFFLWHAGIGKSQAWQITVAVSCTSLGQVVNQILKF